ncbi:MAG TPA: hypothetical protein VGM77_03950 [Gemmatimonadales bacterium]
MTRRRAGRGFAYRHPDGTPVRDKATLRRIRALAIPPAWRDVWICPAPDGHIQATGRDLRGRKQYRYHQRWQQVRDDTKYQRLRLFGEALPQIRSRVQADLSRRGLPREKVLAAVVRLLETTGIRVGNDEYARQNHSFGLTTLRNRHVDIDGAEIRFRFRGKSGKSHEVTLADARLARMVKQCRDLPGQQLFQYLDDDGVPQAITSTDVNDYLRDAAGQDFSAKDFRTWAGTLLAAAQLAATNESAPRTSLVAAVRTVADQLGNTPAVCRKCYIHPMVLAAYEQPELLEAWQRERTRDDAPDGLNAEEGALLRFLDRPMPLAA